MKGIDYQGTSLYLNVSVGFLVILTIQRKVLVCFLLLCPIENMMFYQVQWEGSRMGFKTIARFLERLIRILSDQDLCEDKLPESKRDISERFSGGSSCKTCHQFKIGVLM